MGAFIEIPAAGAMQPFALVDETTPIGRDIKNVVSLRTDQQVSRFHAAIVRYSAGYCVRDLGSSNGTFVNGELISSDHFLRDGDEIRLGDTTLVFHDELAEDLPPTLIADPS